MKTFKQFSEQTKPECEKKRLQRPNPDEFICRNIGGGKWSTKRKASLQKQQKKRSETLKPLKKDDFVQAARRDLSIKNTEVQNVAKKAYDLEKATKRAQRKEAQLKSKETGKQHDVDHITAQPNRRRVDLQSRWKKVIPGDASANREVIPQSQNLRKNSKNDPNRKKLTRAGAIQTIMRQVRENKTMSSTKDLTDKKKHVKIEDSISELHKLGAFGFHNTV